MQDSIQNNFEEIWALKSVIHVQPLVWAIQEANDP